MADIYQYRRFNESPWEQSAQESKAYTVTIPTSWGTSDFSSITCALYEDPNSTNTNRSTTMLSGSASSSGQVITTKMVTGLTEGYDYRFEVKFTTSEGDTLVCWGIIRATR